MLQNNSTGIVILTTWGYPLFLWIWQAITMTSDWFSHFGCLIDEQYRSLNIYYKRAVSPRSTVTLKKSFIARLELGKYYRISTKRLVQTSLLFNKEIVRHSKYSLGFAVNMIYWNLQSEVYSLNWLNVWQVKNELRYTLSRSLEILF